MMSGGTATFPTAGEPLWTATGDTGYGSVQAPGAVASAAGLAPRTDHRTRHGDGPAISPHAPQGTRVVNNDFNTPGAYGAPVTYGEAVVPPENRAEFRIQRPASEPEDVEGLSPLGLAMTVRRLQADDAFREDVATWPNAALFTLYRRLAEEADPDDLAQLPNTRDGYAWLVDAVEQRVAAVKQRRQRQRRMRTVAVLTVSAVVLGGGYWWWTRSRK